MKEFNYKGVLSVASICLCSLFSFGYNNYQEQDEQNSFDNDSYKIIVGKINDSVQNNPKYSIQKAQQLFQEKSVRNNLELSAKVNLVYAKALRESGNYDEALLTITKVIQSPPSDSLYAALLNEKGKVLHQLGNYNESFESYLKALKYAPEKNYQQVIDAYTGLGTVGYISGRYLESLSYYEKALNLTDSVGDNASKAELFNSIANVYFTEQNYTQALHFLNQAKDINEQQNNPKRVAVNLGNLSQVYLSIDSVKQAKQLLNKAIEIDKQLDNQSGMAIKMVNLAAINAQEGKLEEAIQLGLSAYATFKEIEKIRGMAFTCSNLGAYYTRLKDYTNAGNYLELASFYANDLHDLYLISQIKINYADLYAANNNYKKAHQYCREHMMWKDSIFSTEKHQYVANMEAKYELKKKENQIKLQSKELEIYSSKEKLNKLKNHSLIIGLTLFLIVGIFIYFRKTAKAKQEKLLREKDKEVEQAKLLLMESNLERIALEQKKLEDELKFKDHELTNYALQMAQKNELLNKLKQDLKAFSPKTKNKENQKIIQELLAELNQHLSNDHEIELFQQKIDKEHFGFFQRLHEQFPDLTKNEKRLCAFLRINLSSKEIASINNTTYKAVEMARYRLRKKLNIDNQVNLTDFLNKLN